MKHLKASEVRALIGRLVPITRLRPNYSDEPRLYVVLDVQGRNVEVECYGYRDWLWLPDLLFGDPVVPTELEADA